VVGWVGLKIIEGWYRILGAVGEKRLVELVINSLLTYAA